MSNSTFKWIQGLIGLVNSNGDAISSTADGSKERLDVGTGAEELNEAGDRSIRIITTDPLILTKKTLTKNSILSYEGQSKVTDADTSLSIWKITRTSTVGGETTVDSLDDGNFSQIWDNVESLFPTPAFSNTNSLSLNGSTQDANGGDIHKYDIGQAFSVGMWVNPQNLSSDRILFAKAGPASAVDGYMLRHNATTGALFLQMRSTINRSHTFDTTLTAGSYQFVVFTYSGSSNISGASAYVNAVKNSSSPSGSLSGTMLVGQDFTLGSRNSGFYYSGLMDEITVWNKELTQLEVTELYNSGSPTDPTLHSAAANLQSYYPVLDDGGGNPNMVDSVGGDNLTTNGILSVDVP